MQMIPANFFKNSSFSAQRTFPLSGPWSRYLGPGVSPEAWTCCPPPPPSPSLPPPCTPTGASGAVTTVTDGKLLEKSTEDAKLKMFSYIVIRR